MGKISNQNKYAQDSLITGAEYLIGTNEDNVTTVTFSIDSIKDYIENNISLPEGGIGVSDQTLTGNRIVETSGFDLSIQDNSIDLLVIDSTGNIRMDNIKAISVADNILLDSLLRLKFVDTTSITASSYEGSLVYDSILNEVFYSNGPSWISASGGAVASSVSFAPTSNITSTDVQAAIEEVDLRSLEKNTTNIISSSTRIGSDPSFSGTQHTYIRVDPDVSNLVSIVGGTSVALSTSLSVGVSGIVAFDQTEAKINAIGEALITRDYADNNYANIDVISNVATSTIIGRVTAGSGDSEELTPTQIRTLLNVEDNSTADQNASEVPFTPYLTVTSTDVQAAIQELKDEVDLGGGSGVTELSDLTDVGTSTPTNLNVIGADGVDFNSTALTSAHIQSGTFSDARIASSNVTQHQASINITESQISDLGSYQDLLISGTNIKTINSTSILGAGNIVAGGDLWSDTVDANIIPDGDSTRDIGSDTVRFANVYTDKLELGDSAASNVIIDFQGVFGLRSLIGTANDISYGSQSLSKVETGIVAPTSTPLAVGDIYVDTVLDNVYSATGTASSSDWTLVNAGGGLTTDQSNSILNQGLFDYAVHVTNTAFVAENIRITTGADIKKKVINVVEAGVNINKTLPVIGSEGENIYCESEGNGIMVIEPDSTTFYEAGVALSNQYVEINQGKGVMFLKRNGGGYKVKGEYDLKSFDPIPDLATLGFYANRTSIVSATDTDGANVTAWNDLSGNANNAAALTAGTLNIDAAGNRQINFVALSTQSYNLGQPTEMLVTAGTDNFYIIGKWGETVGEGTVISTGGTGANRSYHVGVTDVSTVPNYRLRLGGTATNDWAVVLPNQVFIIEVTGATFNAFVDGVQVVTTGTVGSTNTTNDIYIGNWSNTGNFYLEGDLQMLTMGKGTLTAQNITDIWAAHQTN